MATEATTIGKHPIGRYFPPELKVRGYLLAIILAAVPIFSYCILQSILLESWDWLYLALFAALVSCFPLRIFSIQDRIWLTLSDVFVFIALFQFGTEVAVVIASIEAITFNLRRRPKETYQWAFNLAQIVVVAFLVGQLFELMVSWTSWSENTELAAVTLFLTAPWVCGFLYYSLSSGLTGLAVALDNSHSFTRTWLKNLSWYYVSVVGAVLAALTHLFVQHWL